MLYKLTRCVFSLSKAARFVYSPFLVVGNIVLSSTNYDTFEADGTVSVCAMIMAEAIETMIIVQLSSQDSTAISKNDSTVVSQAITLSRVRAHVPHFNELL